VNIVSNCVTIQIFGKSEVEVIAHIHHWYTGVVHGLLRYYDETRIYKT
jgi:hypothetical protein